MIGRRMFRTPLMRRITYAVIFEGLAIAFTTLILAALGHDTDSSLIVGVLSSAVALAWNLTFNWLFEKVERATGITGRPLWVRAIHAVVFETGLLLFLLPLIALVLQVSLVEAFWLQAGLIIFFLLYTAVYAWVFDRVFGLPDAAQKAQEVFDDADECHSHNL